MKNVQETNDLKKGIFYFRPHTKILTRRLIIAYPEDKRLETLRATFWSCFEVSRLKIDGEIEVLRFTLF